MILYLEKRGCDFFENDAEKVRGSDLENYRLFLEFIDRDGVRVCGDIMMGDARERYTKKNGKTDYKVVSKIGMFAHFQYEDRKGCFCYNVDTDGLRYTKADALKLINSISAVQYDAVELVHDLPDAARAYPSEVMALAEAREAREHELYAAEMIQTARENWAWLIGNANRYELRKLTVEEYKRVCLASLEAMRDAYGTITQGKTTRAPGVLAAHKLTKTIFEEQTIFNACEDQAFINAALPLAPYHVARYLDKMTLEQFAAAFAQG